MYPTIILTIVFLLQVLFEVFFAHRVSNILKSFIIKMIHFMALSQSVDNAHISLYISDLQLLFFHNKSQTLQVFVNFLCHLLDIRTIKSL